MTGELVNLRQRRKQETRAAARQAADANATRHGRAKAEKTLAAARAAKAARDLDGHRRESRGEPPES